MTYWHILIYVSTLLILYTITGYYVTCVYALLWITIEYGS